MQCSVTDRQLNIGILPAAMRCLLCPLKLSVDSHVSQAGNLPTRFHIWAAEDSCGQIVMLMTHQSKGTFPQTDSDFAMSNHVLSRQELHMKLGILASVNLSQNLGSRLT